MAAWRFPSQVAPQLALAQAKLARENFGLSSFEATLLSAWDKVGYQSSFHANTRQCLDPLSQKSADGFSCFSLSRSWQNVVHCNALETSACH